jgi:quercetin dioxygenase-like cupin family protein
MSVTPNGSPPDPPAPVPPDDPRRTLVRAPADGPGATHVGVAGGTYTILLSAADTAGRYALIDMYVPPGGGPAPHRHDFEESFTVLEGESELTFRGETAVARAGETVLIPANAPHRFVNASDRPARLLCICAPAGQEQFFLDVGTRVAGRTTAPPPLDGAARATFLAKARALAPKYRTEFVPPGGA